jgi:hypothetical protein
MEKVKKRENDRKSEREKNARRRERVNDNATDQD